MSNPRPLNWRLRQSEGLEAVTDTISPVSVTPDYFPLDPDEKVSLELNISLNEFIQLASTIDVGRDIAYGDDSVKIWNLWSTVIMPIILDCQDVANCIDTSAEVQQSISSTLDQSGNINPDKSDSNTTTMTRLPQYSTDSVAPPPDNCDLDKLWSGIREMVARIDDKGRDVLEDLALINDKAEQIQGLIDIVPLLGDIIADVAEFFTQAVPDLLNGYNAFSNETEIDNLACELFSMVCNECRYPTFEEVLSVYSSKSIAGLATNPQLLNYSQVWGFVRQLPAFNGSLTYHSVNTWQLITYYFGSVFSRSRGKNTLNIWTSIGEELPTDNWILLCNGCPASGVIERLDGFGNDDMTGYPVAVSPPPTYIPADDWYISAPAPNVAQSASALGIELGLLSTRNVTKVTVRANIQPTYDPTYDGIYIYTRVDQNPRITQLHYQVSGSGIYTASWVPPSPVQASAIDIEVLAGNLLANDSARCYLLYVLVEYE